LKPPYFNSRLEALRGVAAMMVAVWHSLAVLPGSGVKADVIASLRRLTNGNAAVTLFFVLSGFVLGLSLRKAGECSRKQFLGFCVRRLFRIYPVFLFSTLLVVACLYYSHYMGGLFPAWFNSPSDYRQTELNPGLPPSAALVLGNLLLWCPTLNYPTWTLGIELRCSLLLPLLYWWSGRLSARGRSMLLLALMFMACLGKWCLLLGSPAAEAIVAQFISGFAGFLFLFYLGYLLPEAGPVIFGKLKASPIASLLLPWAPAVVWLWSDSWGDDFRLLQGTAAAMVIGHLLYGGQERPWRMLDHPLARFYGRISFSFYLWHDLMLVVTARTLLHFAPMAARPGSSILWSAPVLLASIGFTTGVAILCYKFIERPFIDYGKRLTGKLFPAMAAADNHPRLLPSPESAPRFLEASPTDRAA